MVGADTMEPSTALTTSAQIAVAIAGFAGVVAVFRTGSVHDWGRVEKFWLRLLLVNSILPLAFSMFGLILLAVTPVPPTIWRWCSGFAALILLLYGIVILKTLVGFAPGQLEAAGGTRFTSYSLLALLVLVSLLQLGNVATLAAFWPFFGAIAALLLGSMYQFVRLVLVPQHGRMDAPREEGSQHGAGENVARKVDAQVNPAVGHPCGPRQDGGPIPPSADP
jgi:hypothetical protein